MSDSLVLKLLRAIPADISEIKTDIVEMKERLGLIEAKYSALSRRVDRLPGDMEFVKRRLNLVAAPIA